MSSVLLAAAYADVRPIRKHLGLTEGVSDIVVAVRHGTSFSTSVHDSTAASAERLRLSQVCDMAILCQLKLGVRTALTRGWRLDQGDSLCNYSGSTHRDQLLTREWSGLLVEVGARRLLELLSSLQLCVFRLLEGSCLLQLTGIPFDDELRLLLRAAPVNNLPIPTSGPAPLPAGVSVDSCMRGAWVLPRADARVPAAYRGFGLKYCRPLFYASSPRSPNTRHGLPSWHILNSLRVSTPSGTGCASIATSPETIISSNTARRLVHHIFVVRPHVTDILAYNGALASQTLQQPTLGLVQQPGSPSRQSAPARLQSRPQDPSSAALTNAGLSMPAILGASQKPSTSDATTVPKALARAVPAFLALLVRHSRCRSELCELSCAAGTAEPTPTTDTSTDICERTAGFKRRDRLAAERPLSQLAAKKRPRLDECLSINTEAPHASKPASCVALPVLLPPEQCAMAPLQHVTPPDAVMAYLRDCLGRVLPPALWGGSANRRHILRLVWAWVSRGKRDRLPVSDLLHGCRVTGFEVFRSRASAGKGAAGARATDAAVQSWLAWLLLGFVTPLLRTSFYVTDSEVYHHRPLYFRRETWDRLSDAAVLQLRQTLKLLPLEPAAAAAAIGTTSLGVAGMRLSPKRSALRPIMNMAAVHVGAALLERAHRGAEATTGTHRVSAEGCSADPTTAALGDASMPPAPARALPASSVSSGGPRSVNKQLEAVHEVLKLARRKAPGAMGAAVFGLDGIYASLRRFAAVRGSRADSAANATHPTLAVATSPPLYMFCCDVTAAYDSIVQSIAFGHVEELLPPAIDRYEVRSYTEVSASGWAVVAPGTHEDASKAQRAILSAARIRFRRVAVACDASFVPFHRQVAALAAESHNTIFLDGSYSESVTREQCLAAIKKVVWHHQVASPDGRAWLQTRGVPQGSIVSSFLCNAYLGGLERKELLPSVSRLIAPHVQEQVQAAEILNMPTSQATASLLMRLTDDIFLVTEDAAVAAAAQQVLCAGFPRYAVRINPAKTQASFTVPSDGSSLPGVALPLAQLVPLSWCGLLLCPATGAITSDYSRYFGAGALEDSIAVSLGPSPCEAVTRMVRAFLRPKCHPVLLDGHINSLRTVALNVFQMAVIAAAKLIIVLHRLPGGEEGTESRESRKSVAMLGGWQPSRRAALAVRVSIDATSYLVALVRRRCPGRFLEVQKYDGAAATASNACCDRVLILGPSATWNLSTATDRAETSADSHSLRPSAPEEGEATASHAQPASAAPLAALPPSWCPLRNAEVRWLCLTAFARAFARSRRVAHFAGVAAELTRVRAETVSPPQPDPCVSSAPSLLATHPATLRPGAIRLCIRAAANPELTPWLSELDF